MELKVCSWFLKYLQWITRPDISMAVYQCACFSNRGNRSYVRAIQKIARYFVAFKIFGVLFKSKKAKDIELC